MLSEQADESLSVCIPQKLSPELPLIDSIQALPWVAKTKQKRPPAHLQMEWLQVSLSSDSFAQALNETAPPQGGPTDKPP